MKPGVITYNYSMRMEQMNLIDSLPGWSDFYVQLTYAASRIFDHGSIGLGEVHAG
jgi:hypothetical protein